MKIFLSVIFCLTIFGSLEINAQCSSPNGTFAVDGSCDTYVECRNGIAEEKVCPDGLLFNQYSTGYPCGYPVDVECVQGRTQPAQPTVDCPHQFGYYRVGDAANCGQFMNCADGVGYMFNCPEGLAWNEESYRCDWPDQVPACDVENFLGFKCPSPGYKSAILGEQEEEYQFYPSNYNCQKYFICIEGRPRLIGCGEDKAFNPETRQCDEIENVPSCSADIQAKGLEIRNARLAAAEKKLSADDSRCLVKNGRFASGGQCDAYVECQGGEAFDRICPDGLLFHQRTKSQGECTYAPFSTCQERTALQPPNGTEHCPRQFGFYSLGEPTKCGAYKNCAHGVATITKCPEGLAFNEQTYQCDWPDQVADCNAEAFLGFTCPSHEDPEHKPVAVDISNEGELLYYRHPESCKKYFVCVNGHPRLYTCGRYLAFNPETKLCDFYTHVPDCQNQKSKF